MIPPSCSFTRGAWQISTYRSSWQVTCGENILTKSFVFPLPPRWNNRPGDWNKSRHEGEESKRLMRCRRLRQLVSQLTACQFSLYSTCPTFSPSFFAVQVMSPHPSASSSSTLRRLLETIFSRLVSLVKQVVVIYVSAGITLTRVFKIFWSIIKIIKNHYLANY